MYAKSVVAMALLAGVAVAQNNTINPNNISLTIRSQWCQGQQSTCGTLCSGSPGNNTCDPNTLAWSCTCTSNGSTPGLQYYTQTMPTFICEQVFSNCISNNVGDAAAQTLCKTNEANNCGHLNPDNFTSDSTTTTTSASTTATATGSTASTVSSSTSKAAAATLAAVRNFGSGAVAVGVAAAFGYML